MNAPTPKKKVRLYTASRTTAARNIMLAFPDQALGWMLDSLAKMQAEVRAKMTRDGQLPVIDNDEAPTITLTFDVKGVPADAKEKVNGQDIGI